MCFGATFANASEYPYLYRSPSYLGRGDTGIAAADGEEAIYYNPAGLAQGKGIFKQATILSPTFEYSNATKQLIQDVLAPDSEPINIARNNVGAVQHFGFSNVTSLVLRRAAASVFVNSSVSALFYKDPSIGAFEGMTANAHGTGGFTFSLAHVLIPKTRSYIGVTGKFVRRAGGEFTVNAADILSSTELGNFQDRMGIGSGVGADVGLMFIGGKRTPVAFGVVLQDAGNTSFTYDDTLGDGFAQKAPDPIKMTLNVGVAIMPTTRTSNLKMLADFRDVLGNVETSIFKRIHIGGELNVLNRVGFTGGLNQGYPTAGFYVDIKFFRLDAGVYTEEFGDGAGNRPDTRVFTRLWVGL